jgi:hypothetical protein
MNPSNAVTSLLFLVSCSTFAPHQNNVSSKTIPEVFFASEKELWFSRAEIHSIVGQKGEYTQDFTNHMPLFIGTNKAFLYVPSYKGQDSFEIQAFKATFYDIPGPEVIGQDEFYKVRERIHKDCNGYPNRGVRIEFKASGADRNFHGGYIFPEGSVALNHSELSKLLKPFKKVHLKYLHEDFHSDDLDEKYIETHTHGLRTPSGNIYVIAPRPVRDFFDATRIYRVERENVFIPLENGHTISCST